MSEVTLITLGLTAAGGVMFYIIAADRTRYLARFDLQRWNERLYLSNLPNFLQYLNDRGFVSPWSRKINAVSAWWFRTRVRRVLQSHPSMRKNNFMELHFGFQALLFMLKPFIDDFILSAQAKLAGERILVMPDTTERDRLIGFVGQVSALRAQFYSSLTELDKHVMLEMARRNFLSTLRSANAMFHEHGFDDIFPGLDALRRWQSLEGKELVQELPTLPKTVRDASRHSVGVLPFSNGSQSEPSK